MNFRAAAGRSAIVSILIFANTFAASAQSDSIYRLPAGTRIWLKMTAELNSRISSVNDTFVAAVSRPVMVRDAVVLVEGTQIEGRVLGVRPASYGGKAGKLELVFETVKITDDVHRAIEGTLVAGRRNDSSVNIGLIGIAGGAGAGAVIGAASGSRQETLIGSVAGALGGTLFAFVRKGKNVRFAKGQEFQIELRKELVLPVLDF